ncbi:hypothetical protein [Streptomyces sp. NPDC000410]|uniref:hypothetical protein n=1 Tax=Streptomyces sp. NPDC000410 TaxID=3154254 RepID=UPI003328EE3B
MTYGGHPHSHPAPGAAPAGFGPPMPVPQPYPPQQQQPYAPPQQPYAPPQQQPYAPQPYAAPEFMAHDKRNSVIVDDSGVALEINGHIMEFPWAVIGTVHHAPAPSGNVLMVAVAHPSGVLYECRVAARRREQLLQWLAELPHVLGYYLANRPPAVQ